MPDLRTKHVDESELFNFNFAARSQIAAGLTIASAVITQDDPPDAALVIGAPTISGSRVQALYSGGTLGKVYTVHCAATLSDGELVSMCGLLHITKC